MENLHDNDCSSCGFYVVFENGLISEWKYFDAAGYAGFSRNDFLEFFDVE